MAEDEPGSGRFAVTFERAKEESKEKQFRPIPADAFSSRFFPIAFRFVPFPSFPQG